MNSTQNKKIEQVKETTMVVVKIAKFNSTVPWGNGILLISKNFS